jgi:hypothetical protein
MRGNQMEELERIVITHSQVRRLSNAELRAEVNRCFEERDYRRSWALYLELQHRQDRGTWDVPAPAWARKRP